MIRKEERKMKNEKLKNIEVGDEVFIGYPNAECYIGDIKEIVILDDGQINIIIKEE